MGAINQRSAVLKVLLADKRVNPNIAGDRGVTALMLAARREDTSMLELLLLTTQPALAHQIIGRDHRLLMHRPASSEAPAQRSLPGPHAPDGDFPPHAPPRRADGVRAGRSGVRGGCSKLPRRCYQRHS